MLYLECQEHDPPIRASKPSGRTVYELPKIRAMVAQREYWIAEYEATHREAPSAVELERFFGQYDLNTVVFLQAHPRCRIRLADNEGNHYDGS